MAKIIENMTVFGAARKKFPDHDGHEFKIIGQSISEATFELRCACDAFLIVEMDDIDEFESFGARAEIPKGYSATFTVDISPEDAQNLRTWMADVQGAEQRLRMLALFRHFPEHLACPRVRPAHQVKSLNLAGYTHEDFDDPIMASMAGLIWHCMDCETTMILWQRNIDALRERRESEIAIGELAHRLEVIAADRNIHTASSTALDRLGIAEGIIRHEGDIHRDIHPEPDVDYRERILEVTEKPSRQVDPANPPKPKPKTNITINHIEMPEPSRIEIDANIFGERKPSAPRKGSGVAALPGLKPKRLRGVEINRTICVQGDEDGDI